jgi:hypothetical protein
VDSKELQVILKMSNESTFMAHECSLMSADKLSTSSTFLLELSVRLLRKQKCNPETARIPVAVKVMQSRSWAPFVMAAS